MSVLDLILASSRAGAAVGGARYETEGWFTWTCPPGVYSVCVVVVGRASEIAGEPAGALSWKNDIPVTPGSTYAVHVSGIYTLTTNSYFITEATVSAGQGDVRVGQGGGDGGVFNYGAGGAGGYTGNGGSGSYLAPSGGGGAGGNYASEGYLDDPGSWQEGQGGGGVGLFGQGASGSGLQQGGSGGEDGNGTSGGHFGGGTGYYYAYESGSTYGAPGRSGIRIIWGAGRAFPSTNTGQNYGGFMETVY